MANGGEMSDMNQDGMASGGGKSLGGQDFEDMLNALQDLTDTGATEQARQLLSDITNMLQNLDFQRGQSGTGMSGMPGSQSDGEDQEDVPQEEQQMTDAMRRLSEILREQRQLNDDTLAQQRGDLPNNPSGQSGQESGQQSGQQSGEQSGGQQGQQEGQQAGQGGQGMPGDPSAGDGSQGGSRPDGDVRVRTGMPVPTKETRRRPAARWQSGRPVWVNWWSNSPVSMVWAKAPERKTPSVVCWIRRRWLPSGKPSVMQNGIWPAGVKAPHRTIRRAPRRVCQS